VPGFYVCLRVVFFRAYDDFKAVFFCGSFCDFICTLCSLCLGHILCFLINPEPDLIDLLLYLIIVFILYDLQRIKDFNGADFFIIEEPDGYFAH